MRLFGDTKAFTAQVDVRVYGSDRKETLRAPMNFELLDGRMRMDFDMSSMQGSLIQPGVTKIMNQAGLNQVASIMRLDKRLIHLVFNRAQSYINLEIPRQEVEAAEANVQVQRTPLGKETIANRSCSKNKVVVKNAKGAALLEATTWNSEEMQGFPIQIMVQTKEGTTLLRFSQVKFTRPAASRFDPPRGFTKYEDQDALLLAAMQKRVPPVTSVAPAAGTQPAPSNQASAAPPKSSTSKPPATAARPAPKAVPAAPPRKAPPTAASRTNSAARPTPQPAAPAKKKP